MRDSVSTPATPVSSPGEQHGAADPSVLLQHIHGIGHPCDLDLLLFFQRHPCALLAVERLTACLGYGIDQVAKSLDGLAAAGLLARSRNRSSGASLYRLEPNNRPELSSLLSIAVTCAGRRDLMRLLGPEPDSGAGRRFPACIVKAA